MTDLLQFPDDATKALRRARAEAVQRAERDANVVVSYVELLDDLTAAKPDGKGAGAALALASWIADVLGLLGDIMKLPAHIRMEAGITERCLKLKGLVDEAELACLVHVERAAARSCMDDALEVNKDLINRARRFGRDDRGPIFIFDSTPGAADDWVRGRFLDGSGASQVAPGRVVTGARRAPVSPLTPDLVSFDLQLPAGAPLASGETASAVIPPSSSVAAFAVHCLGYAGRSVAELRSTTSLVCALFHGATLPRLLRKVLEKTRGIFSRKGGAA